MKAAAAGTFGHEIRRRRELLGWDQRSLALEVGVSVTSLSKYERNVGVWTMGTGAFYHLSRVLSWACVDMYKLLEKEDPRRA